MTIAGKYELVSSDKYDDYLKAIGVSLVNRTLANNAKPVMEYIDHGNGKWTQKTIALIKTIELNFVLGQEFEETTPDDRKANTTLTLDGNTLVQKQRVGDTVATTTRVFTDSGMTTTFSAGGVTAVRTFKKVA